MRLSVKYAENSVPAGLTDPIASQPQSLDGKPAHEAGKIAMPDNTKRILVVDDDEYLRPLICRALKQAGYSDVTEANDGREGLELCGKTQFDLVITDIIMPEMDGMDVIFSLQKKSPGTRIIAMSGGGRIDAEKYLRIARIAGAGILEKPFSLPKLLEMVAREVGGGKI